MVLRGCGKVFAWRAKAPTLVVGVHAFSSSSSRSINMMSSYAPSSWGDEGSERFSNQVKSDHAIIWLIYLSTFFREINWHIVEFFLNPMVFMMISVPFFGLSDYLRNDEYDISSCRTTTITPFRHQAKRRKSLVRPLKLCSLDASQDNGLMPSRCQAACEAMGCSCLLIARLWAGQWAFLL